MKFLLPLLPPSPPPPPPLWLFVFSLVFPLLLLLFLTAADADADPRMYRGRTSDSKASGSLRVKDLPWGSHDIESLRCSPDGSDAVLSMSKSFSGKLLREFEAEVEVEVAAEV